MFGDADDSAPKIASRSPREKRCASYKRCAQECSARKHLFSYSSSKIFLSMPFSVRPRKLLLNASCFALS